MTEAKTKMEMDALHKNGAHLIVASDPLALVSARPPAEFGADVVVDYKKQEIIDSLADDSVDLVLDERREGHVS